MPVKVEQINEYLFSDTVQIAIFRLEENFDIITCPTIQVCYLRATMGVEEITVNWLTGLLRFSKVSFPGY